MNTDSSEVTIFKPTNDLRRLFGAPALVGQEKQSDYEKLADYVDSAIKPTDPIGWLLAKDVTDWTWEILRERVIKAEIIKHFQKEIIADLMPLIVPPNKLSNADYRIHIAECDVMLWATDPASRIQIDNQLAEKGHSPSSILAQAYMRGASHIDAIDGRIASYERRAQCGAEGSGILERAPEASA